MSANGEDETSVGVHVFFFFCYSQRIFTPEKVLEIPKDKFGRPHLRRQMLYLGQTMSCTQNWANVNSHVKVRILAQVIPTIISTESYMTS